MDAQGALDACCEQVQRVRRVLKKGTSRQVQSGEERGLVKSTAHTWFNAYLPLIAATIRPQDLIDINGLFRQLLECADKNTTRTRYDLLLKDLGKQLGKFRVDFVSGTIQPPAINSDDTPPDFSALTADSRMRAILDNRWGECVKCVRADASLAATVMMGGLLESLLMARVNTEPNKGVVFRSVHIPIAPKTGKQIPIQDWMLRTYIDVAHDLKWITQSAKDIGEVLRDYRNYIHPQKQYSHNVELGEGDALLFWQLTKSIARQLAK